MAKTTGEPCRQAAMANGRCAYHGGRTPSGDDWHKPRWPKASAANWGKKLARKLRDLERARLKRERRVQSMSSAERAQYDAWQRAHQPGSAGQRANARDERKRRLELAADFAALSNRETVRTPAMRELDALIAAAQAALAEIEAEIAAFDAAPLFPEPPEPDAGVFG